MRVAFTLLPRMLLTKLPRGGEVPKNKLLERVQKFASGQWMDFPQIEFGKFRRPPASCVREGDAPNRTQSPNELSVRRLWCVWEKSQRPATRLRDPRLHLGLKRL